MGYDAYVSYAGYIPHIKNFIHHRIPNDQAPRVLEVGIDRGTTLIPIAAFLARARLQFTLVGIDVKVQEQVVTVIQNLDLQPNQIATCIEGNSLEVLPKMAEAGMRFDVVLIDGDHNYHTVSRELSMLEDLVVPNPLVICDDYSGRWSERDLWYAERDGYQDVSIATRRVETNKAGVKAAVDEWLSTHVSWQSSQPLIGEPIVLTRKAT